MEPKAKTAWKSQRKCCWHCDKDFLQIISASVDGLLKNWEFTTYLLGKSIRAHQDILPQLCTCLSPYRRLSSETCRSRSALGPVPSPQRK